MLNLPDGKLYNFFIDDNVFFFTDIYKKNCKSIFDHFYLENLRKIHQKYGTLFTLNCFRHNRHEPDFDISLFPDKYRSEFEDNARWLRLAFHADSEQPPYPYGKAYPEKLAEHYLRFAEEIIRIAGEKCFIAPVIIHCFDVDDRGRKFLRKNGMKCFAVRDAQSYTFNPNFDQLEMAVDMFLNLYYSDLEQMKRSSKPSTRRFRTSFSRRSVSAPRSRSSSPKRSSVARARPFTSSTTVNYINFQEELPCLQNS